MELASILIEANLRDITEIVCNLYGFTATDPMLVSRMMQGK